jgi:hypothetical protein
MDSHCVTLINRVRQLSQKNCVRINNLAADISALEIDRTVFPGGVGPSFIFLSNGGNNIGAGGSFVGQGNVNTLTPRGEILLPFDGTITRLIATKDGGANAAGTASLAINGVVDAAYTVALSAGSDTVEIEATRTVSAGDRLAAFFTAGMGGWQYGAATITYIPG